jgi:branched-chain amino acid transport system permease protein
VSDKASIATPLAKPIAKSAVARLALSVVVLALVALLPLTKPNEFVLQLAELSLVYGLLAISLNVSFGRLNSLPFSQAGFFGLGAYATGIVFQHTDSFWLALAATLCLALVVSLLLGWVTAHLSGFQFAIVTLAVAGLFQLVVTHWSVTGATTGVMLNSDVRLNLGFASVLLDSHSTYALTAVTFALLLLATDAVLRAGIGDVLLSVRDHPNFSRSLGFSPEALRLGAFVVSSVLGAIAGCLYFCYQGIAAPSSFGQQIALLLALMIIIGGKGYFWAPLLGAIAYVVVPQTVNIGQNYVWLSAGALMIVCVIALPKGIVGAGAALADRLFPERTATPPGLEQQVIERARGAIRATVQRSSTERLLHVENLTRRFGGLTALSDVNLSVSGGGEVVGVIGANGSGKTTLFNVVSGHLVPHAGRVVFDGFDITGVRPEDIARIGLVRTFQEGAVFPDLTVEQSFAVAGLGALASDPKAFVRSALAGSLSRSWMRREVQVGNLSYGAQRLLMIGTALATHPKLIMLDEPAAGLGAQEGRWVVEIIKEASARGISVVLIEHHMDLVTDACHRLVVLGGGREVTSGTCDEVMRDPRVVESLLGRFGKEVLDGIAHDQRSSGAATAATPRRHDHRV